MAESTFLSFYLGRLLVRDWHVKSLETQWRTKLARKEFGEQRRHRPRSGMHLDREYVEGQRPAGEGEAMESLWVQGQQLSSGRLKPGACTSSSGEPGPSIIQAEDWAWGPA